jgi:hypothetical protein
LALQEPARGAYVFSLFERVVSVRAGKLSTYLVSRHLSIMHAFAAIAVERDRFISKDVVDQLIHSRFAERTPLATFTLEGSGTLDFFYQEIINVWRAK